MPWAAPDTRPHDPSDQIENEARRCSPGNEKNSWAAAANPQPASASVFIDRLERGPPGLDSRVMHAVELRILPEREQDEILCLTLVVERVLHAPGDEDDHSRRQIKLFLIKVQDRLAFHGVIDLILFVNAGAGTAPALQRTLIDIDGLRSRDEIIHEQLRRVAVIADERLHPCRVDNLFFSHFQGPF